MSKKLTNQFAQNSIQKANKYMKCVQPLSLHAQMLSHVRLSVTPRTVAHQASLAMGFSLQE